MPLNARQRREAGGDAGGGDPRWGKFPGDRAANHARGRPAAEFVALEGFEEILPADSAKVDLAIGVDRLLWSSDFPHGGSDWPNSWRTIDANFADVPRAERDAILAGNAERLFKFASAEN